MKKILVVDDDEGFRALSTEILELADFSVDNARDGADPIDIHYERSHRIRT